MLRFSIIAGGWIISTETECTHWKQWTLFFFSPFAQDAQQVTEHHKCVFNHTDIQSAFILHLARVKKQQLLLQNPSKH